MANPVGYVPFFKGKLPSDVVARWELIYRFLNFWCLPEGEQLKEASQGNWPLVKQAEKLCDGDLSYSVRQWLGLVEQASNDGVRIRDCRKVGPIEEEFEDPSVCGSTVILEAGEGDVYWAIKNSRLTEDDPPVEVYQYYDESAPALLGEAGPVSEFSLRYVCLYKGFAVRNMECFSVDCNEQQTNIVRDWFEYSLELKSDEGVYSHFELLESKDVAAIMNDNRIEVSTFVSPEELDLPDCLQSKLNKILKARKRNRRR